MGQFKYSVIGTDHQGRSYGLTTTDRLVSSKTIQGAWECYETAKASGLFKHILLVQKFDQIIAEEDLDDTRRVHSMGSEAGTTPEGV